jgi:hypothetical protein
MIPALRRYLIVSLFCLTLLPAYAVARVFMSAKFRWLLGDIWDLAMRWDGRRG